MFFAVDVDVEAAGSSTQQSGLVWDLMVALWGRLPHVDPDGKHFLTQCDAGLTLKGCGCDASR